jgi:hypothetical protein
MKKVSWSCCGGPCDISTHVVSSSLIICSADMCWMTTLSCVLHAVWSMLLAGSHQCLGHLPLYHECVWTRSVASHGMTPVPLRGVTHLDKLTFDERCAGRETSVLLPGFVCGKSSGNSYTIADTDCSCWLCVDGTPAKPLSRRHMPWLVAQAWCEHVASVRHQCG